MFGALRRFGVRSVALRRYSTEVTLEEERAMSQLREILRTRSFTAEKVDMSPELREKVAREFDSFISEFALDHEFTDELNEYFERTLNNTTSLHEVVTARPATKMEHGNMRGFAAMPKLKRSQFEEPYTSQELFLRRLFHASSVAGSGAVVTDAYRPHEDVFAPASIKDTSVATLLAAGAHLGHITSRVRANCLPFIYGERDGIHIIDLDQTLTFLRRAAAVVEGVAQQGGIILFVGTRDGQERSVEVSANRAGGYYVHTRWAPGTLTNATNMSNTWERLEVDMGDRPTSRTLGTHLKSTIVKPDLVVVLNPVENRPMLNECLTARVPTIGLVDTDSEPSLLTYPIPANDDSLRACDLVLGVLSNAAKRGRETRLADFGKFKQAEELAKSGEGFNA